MPTDFGFVDQDFGPFPHFGRYFCFDQTLQIAGHFQDVILVVPFFVSFVGNLFAGARDAVESVIAKIEKWITDGIVRAWPIHA